MSIFSERLNYAMQIKQLKQADLSRITGLDKSLICNYVSGKYKAKQDKLYILAEALNVSEAWLMGCDVPMEREKMPNKIHTEQANKIIEIFNNLSPEAQDILFAVIKSMQSKE